MKTTEELNAIKADFEAMKARLADLTDEELKVVTGSGMYNRDPRVPYNPYPEFEELEKEMQKRLSEYYGN